MKRQKRLYRFIYFFTFLGSLNPAYQDAAETTRQALLETPVIKQDVKNLQNSAEWELYDKTGLTPQDLVLFGYAYPIVTGKISTKPFQDLKYTTKSKFVVRPEVEYNLWTGESTYLIRVFSDY